MNQDGKNFFVIMLCIVKYFITHILRTRAHAPGFLIKLILIILEVTYVD